MKQSLQLNLGQHLAMTPQLQQAIRLLQLSTLELNLEVQQALDSNLMLEQADDNAPDTEASPEETRKAEADASTDATETEVPGSESEIPDELPVDSNWDDVYDATAPAASGSAIDSSESEFEIQRSVAESLHDHLMWQLEMTSFSPRDRAIGTAIIDAIGVDGYLEASAEEISAVLEGDEAVENDEVIAVLRKIQNFDPPGVGARDPAECMLIQLHQHSSDTPWLTEAIELVTHHLDLLANQDYRQLKRRMNLPDDHLQEVVHLIRSLTPRPGALIDQQSAQYVTPDVFVRKLKKKWVVELNYEAIPRLRINAGYAGMVRRADNSESNTYLRNHLQEARWFLKSLQSRNETLLKVANCIVEFQRGFFEYGEEAMKPLVLRHVAERVEMHESTISRVTTQKYMHTPKGVFEFKYFFSSHVNTSAGGECSATAIRALIRKLVAAEKPEKPLSDSKIAAILSDQGIKVARRTVAKYREAMGIQSSSERKRLI